MSLFRSALLVTLHGVLSLFVGSASAQAPATLDASAPASPVVQEDTNAREPAGAAEHPTNVATQLTAPGTSISHDARRPDLTVELKHLEQRVVDAEEMRGRQGTAGPVSLIIVASLVGSFFSVGALAEGFALSEIKRNIDQGSYDESNDTNGDGVIDSQDRDNERRVAIAFSAVAITHLGLAAFSTWWLSKRMSARSRLDRELGGLEVERKALQLKLDVSADANGAIGQLIGQF
jgi:hypothetical protein